MEEIQPPAYYAPVFILGSLRFVWFAESLVAATPQEAKQIGLRLEAGYIKAKLPIQAARSVAKFKPEGNYVLAQIGPEKDQRPVLVLNPEESPAQDFEGGASQRGEAAARMDPVEEIAYECIENSGFIRSAKW